LFLPKIGPNAPDLASLAALFGVEDFLVSLCEGKM
jgi:hypothetical protein